MGLDSGGYICPRCQFKQGYYTPFCPNCGRDHGGSDGPNKVNDPPPELNAQTELLYVAKQNNTLLRICLAILVVPLVLKVVGMIIMYLFENSISRSIGPMLR